MNRIVTILGLAIALLGGIAWVYFGWIASGDSGAGPWGDWSREWTNKSASALGLMATIVGAIVFVLGIALPGQKKSA